CLVQAGRYGEANKCLHRMWEEGRIDTYYPELLYPMLTAAWEAGGHDLASVVLNHVETEAPHTAQGNLLRLASMFLSVRLESLASLKSQSTPKTSPPIENR